MRVDSSYIIRLVLVLVVCISSSKTRAANQPPHDEASGTTCADCHIPYAGLNDPATSQGSANTGSNTTQLIDTTKSWTTNVWVDGIITFTSGVNQGQYRTITENTADTIVWADPLGNTLSDGDTYRLGKTTNEDVENKCKSCHNPTGRASSMPDVGMHIVNAGTTTVSCGKCHDPHNITTNSGQGNALIREAVRWPSSMAPTVFPSGGSSPLISGSPNYNGICETCHTDTAYHRNNASGDHEHNSATNCTETCHLHEKGFIASCDSCHDAPPATGAHLRHFAGSIQQVGWGDVGITQDHASAPTTDYIFGCGNCHPLDPAQHQNGTVNVELYNASAPAQSLKAKHPAAANYVPGGSVYTDARGIDYTLGTCSNVYCHSGTEWTTPDGVPIPTTSSSPEPGYFTWNGVYPIVYPPYTLDVERIYATVGWGDSGLGCDECHDYPPRTYDPTNVAGAGDSHSWIDQWGYENLHAWNHGSDPIQCRTCHYDTVTEAATYSRDGLGVTSWDPLSIADSTYHVNGSNTVRFDTTNSITNPPADLSTASWDDSSHTCSNVDCHFNETEVVWGQPYRYENSIECNRCHQY